jgi:branched-chain amino acid transport system permease protein
LQALVTLQFGADSIAVPPILPRGSMSLAGVHVPTDRVYLTGCVVAAAAALWAVGRFTRFGLASRAVAENDLALGLLGWSPNAVAAANWVIAGILAALAGILVGPITSADPLTFSLLIVPALAAALVARFASFAATVATGLAIGMLQSELLEVQVHATWLPASGIGRAIPLVLVVVVAAARGTLLPTRATQLERRLPVVGRPARPVAGAVALFAAGITALSLTHGEFRLALISSIIGALVCLSIVVLTGFLGQLSLAQMAFAGVAGFTLSRLQHDIGVPFPFDALSAALLAALTGLLIGTTALRVRGPALAVATLAGGLAVEALVFEDPRLTGGLAGTRVRPPSLAGLSLGPGSGGAGYPRLAFGVLALVVLCAAVGGVYWLRSSALGRRMLAVRANERAAEATAVAVARTKLVGFTLSAFLAGLAGALVGWQQGQLSFGSFEVFVSLSFVAVTYVGGVGRVSGALVGGALIANGIVFTALDNAFGVGRYQLFVSGIAVVVACVVAPDGLAGGIARGGRWLADRR